MSVEGVISGLKSIEDIKELFISKWNWNHPQISELFCDFTEELRDKIIKSIVIAEKYSFQICYFQVAPQAIPNDKNMKTIQRRVFNLSEIKQIIDRSVFIFSTPDFEYIDFVKAEKVGSAVRIKRFSRTPDNVNRLRTANEQLSCLNLKNSSVTPMEVKSYIEDTFSVEEVSEKFYKGYIDVFSKIKKHCQIRRCLN